MMPGVFVGAEVRNLRHYEGLGLDRFAGQALYDHKAACSQSNQGFEDRIKIAVRACMDEPQAPVQECGLRLARF